MSTRMSGRRILRRFSNSISDLLSIQKKAGDKDVEENPGTALHKAVQLGNAVMLKGLLDGKSIWIDEEDGRGRTALHYAMQSCAEMAELLLKAGANPDCIDYEGLTAAHLAARHGMLDCFDLLLCYHADVCSICKNGKTPFDLACEFGQDKMVERILACGVPWPDLKKAGGSHTASALHLAAINGHIISILVMNHWDINRLLPIGTALHVAAIYGRAQIVRYLLHAGANTSLTNSAGQTAYECAKKNSFNPITNKEIRYLLKPGNGGFAYGEANHDYESDKPNEISFTKGEYIWIIEKGFEGRCKGIAFGKRGNSRSGYFPADAVKIVDKPTLASMSSRIASLPQSTPALPREPKKFNLPTVPITMLNGQTKRVDSNQNLPHIGYRPPSNLSDFSSNDSQNGNSAPHPNAPGNRRSNSNLTSFNCYGTNTGALLLGGPQKSGLASLSAASLMSSSLPCTASASNDSPPAASLSPSTFSQPSSATHPPTGHSFEQIPLGNGVPQLTPTSPLQHHRVSTGSNSSYGSSSGFESMKCSASASSSTSSFVPSRLNGGGISDAMPNRASDQSSGGSGSSSLASTSVHTLDDSVLSCSYQADASTTASTPSAAINVTQLVAKGAPEAEIIANWLDSMHMIEYLSLFLTQGYDLSSIARITPEDLLALGIKNPEHRRRLISEIHTWQITDSWPSVIPIGGLREWLAAIALNEYVSVFESQGYRTVQDLISLNWEDFEDIGVKRLGHLKRLGLAIKKIIDHRRALARGSDYSDNPMLRASRSPNVQIVQSPMLQSRVIHHQQMNAASRPMQNGGGHYENGQRNGSIYSERLHDPPPPAPSSGNSSISRSPLDESIDYISYTRGSKTSNYRPVTCSSDAYAAIDKRRRVHSTPLNDALSSSSSTADDSHTIRLNLIPTAKILSEVEEKDEDEVDGASTAGDYADVPPPPAPLFCNEGSYRLMQRSLRPFSSAVPTTSSADSSTLSLGDLPYFANENCDTIKSRGCVSAREPLEQPAPVVNVANGRKSLSNIYSEMKNDSHPTTSSLAQTVSALSGRIPQGSNDSAVPSANGNANVLTDIGFMLQNLTDELDAMMLMSKQQQKLQQHANDLPNGVINKSTQISNGK